MVRVMLLLARYFLMSVFHSFPDKRAIIYLWLRQTLGKRRERGELRQQQTDGAWLTEEEILPVLTRPEWSPAGILIFPILISFPLITTLSLSKIIQAGYSMWSRREEARWRKNWNIPTFPDEVYNFIISWVVWWGVFVLLAVNILFCFSGCFYHHPPSLVVAWREKGWAGA